jgi:outer membrane protein
MRNCTTSLAGCTLLVCLTALLPPATQAAVQPGQKQDLPAAPQPAQNSRSITEPALAFGALGPAPSQKDSSQSTATPQTDISPQAAGIPMRLTRRDAEQLAIKNNPRITIGRLLALAQHQVYRETRSTELPTFNASITAVDANEGSRMGAGALNAPRLLEHAGAGVSLSQMLTDFGRTTNLVSASKLREKAQNANALATTEDIVLATDQAFYNALEDQALLKVAQQTVTTRDSAERQIDELARNNLKSNLDLTFAQVNLSQAKLLQLDAQNNLDSAMAALAAVLGFDKQVAFDLNDADVQPQPPPADVDGLIRTAFQQRPDLQSLK